MAENKKKPKWGKPKLTILIRGNPEEACLTACKKYAGGGGPENVWNDCLVGPPPTSPYCYTACFFRINS